MDQETKISRGKGRGRGRGRKKAADPEKIVDDTNSINVEIKANEPEAITLDLDADITQLEAPTFSTINKGPPEPMLRLKWDHKTHLIGEKVINPMIHCCDKCEAPILIYGRMIPCKHVFCLTCAECECNTCPRCQEKVVRIERTGLGTVFMCTFGGTRYGNTGCRRTYLSQRDLLAHINHRHVSGVNNNKESLNNNQTTPLSKAVPTVSSRTKPTVTHHVAVAGDPRIQTGSNHEYFYKVHSSSAHASSSQPSHRQSHHHSTSHHHNDHPATTQSNSHSIPHSQAAAQQPTQRHLMSPSQQLIPPPDFVNRILVPNYPPPTPNSVTVPGIRNNLMTMQPHSSNPDSAHPVNLVMAPSFQAFPSQFPPTSSGGIPFPVPPPSQSAINALSQTASQFYSNTPINYSLSSQRPPVSQFSPNSPSQSMLNQSPMLPNQPSTPQMVPPPRRNQFSRENVQQQFPVPQNHRWQQPNQSQFF